MGLQKVCFDQFLLPLNTRDPRDKFETKHGGGGQRAMLTRLLCPWQCEKNLQQPPYVFLRKDPYGTEKLGANS